MDTPWNTPLCQNHLPKLHYDVHNNVKWRCHMTWCDLMWHHDVTWRHVMWYQLTKSWWHQKTTSKDDMTWWHLLMFWSFNPYVYGLFLACNAWRRRWIQPAPTHLQIQGGKSDGLQIGSKFSTSTLDDIFDNTAILGGKPNFSFLGLEHMNMKSHGRWEKKIHQFLSIYSEYAPPLPPPNCVHRV
jgi:hypothetical protein